MKDYFYSLLAGTYKISTGDVPSIPTGDGGSTLNAITDIAYFIAGAAAVIVIIVAGIFYTTSAGDPSKTKRAKDAILYALVGLVVVIFAFTITSYVSGRFA